MTKPVRNYLDDAPASPPGFDFDLIAAALAGVLTEPLDGATVVGIHGPWGAGKTTLMYGIRDELEAQEGSQTVVVEFNAWKYQAREALWRALVLRLVGALRDNGGSSEKLEELERTLYQAFEVSEAGPWSINWRNAATEVASVALEVLQLGFAGRLLRRLVGARGDGKLNEADVERVGKLLERQTVSRHLAQVESIEQFLGAFDELVAELRGAGRRIVVLVDDLDRCLPEAAIEVFEAIKLFLDAPGCGFVVAVDREVIRKGLMVRYAGRHGNGAEQPVADADEYIEKTINISYDVPRLSDDDVDSMIADADSPLGLVTYHRILIGTGLGHNPRRVKRFLNVLRLQTNLARAAAKRGLPAPEPLLKDDDFPGLGVLLKTMLLSYRYPALLRSSGGLTALFELQEAATVYERDLTGGGKRAREERDDKVDKMSAPARALRDNQEFWDLMEAEPDLCAIPGTEGAVRAHVDWFREVGVDGESPSPPEGSSKTR
jgi:hypothetical protein